MLRPDLPVTVGSPTDGEPLHTRVTEVGGTSQAPIVTLEGVDSRTAAEALNGRAMSAPRSVFPPAGEDEFYVGDLEGCEARALDGSRVGTVSRVDLLPANAVLTVTRDNGGPELLVPFTRAVVPDVDLDARAVTIDVGFVDG